MCKIAHKNVKKKLLSETIFIERERERGEREKHTEKEREQNAFGGQDERFSPKEMSMFQRFIATKNQTV